MICAINLFVVYKKCTPENVFYFSVKKLFSNVVELDLFTGLTVCLKLNRNFSSLINSSLNEMFSLYAILHTVMKSCVNVLRKPTKVPTVSTKNTPPTFWKDSGVGWPPSDRLCIEKKKKILFF